MNNAVKYRPSLSLAEIHTILSHLPAHESIIRRKLEIFTLKAQHGITQASHVATGRSSLEDSLGFAPTSSGDDIETLINQYHINPRTLSAAQLAKVNHHRYLNNLMTPEEEAAHEASNI